MSASDTFPSRYSEGSICASASAAASDPMNVAAAAVSKRGMLRTISTDGGSAPQFKPPSTAASAGLKCPEGVGEYEGMDTPMAVCSNCFKKRRAHVPM
jgi:hypothetical protein